MEKNSIWVEKNLDYPATDRVKILHERLIAHSLKDRSEEWFDQRELDEKYRIAEKYSDRTVIIRRARAIEAMLEALTDEELSKNRFTSEIFEGDLLLGNLTMGSNGLGKVFPTYLTEDEKRAGSITNRGSLSLFGHNTVNYEELINNGLEAVIERCEREMEKQKDQISEISNKIDNHRESINMIQNGEINWSEEGKYSIKELKSIIARYIKDKLKMGHQKDFYEAVKISCEAVISYAERFAAIAEAEIKDTNTPERNNELKNMAEIARKVPRKKADTFHEALQSVWFFHLALHTGMNFISLGRLDQTLNPILLKEGKEQYDKCLEIFECFMIKAAWRLNLDLTPSNIVKQDHIDNNTVLGVNPYLIDQKAGVNNFLQNIIIGGVKPDGEDATNDMTFLVLKAFSNVNLSTPGLYIRVGDKTPMELKRAIASTWDTTKNNPSIINDRSMIPAMKRILERGLEASKDYLYRLVKKGVTNLTKREKIQVAKCIKEEFNKLSSNQREEVLAELESASVEGTIKKLEAYYENKVEELANDYCVDGCWEPILNGRSDWTFSMLCALTPMECALNEGAMLSDDPELLRGQKVAPRTRKPRNFEELLEIFSEQLNFFIDQNITSLFLYYMMDEYSCPSPLLSAYMDGCMEYGRDKSWGGAEYNIGGVIMSAVPDVVNTLMAFKKWVVFEDDAKEFRENKLMSTKKYNYDVVIEALRKNFVYENPQDPVQNLFKQIQIDFDSNTPTFGNNNKEADEICQRILDYYDKAVARAGEFAVDTFQKEPDEKDRNRVKALRSIAGYYGESLEEKFGAFNMMISAGLGTFEQYNWSGKGNAASAGRLRGEPITPNFSPTPGTVINGVSGVTESLSKLSLDRFAGGVITDICIEPPVDAERELLAILDAFIDAKGGMMTLTIGDKELYTQIYEEVNYAQNAVKPKEETNRLLEKYAHVNVRIGGWQTPFITLPFSHMRNYINRPIGGMN